MTSGPLGGYQSPQDRGLSELDTSQMGDGQSGSTSDVAKDQAGQVGQTAKGSGKQVAGTAVGEAKNIAGEARRQARDLTREANSQMQQQVGAQKDKAADCLRSLGGELRSMAAQGGQSGPVTDLSEQVAAKVIDLAGWLEQRDPGSLVQEVRRFARRRPGTFLLGAAIAGIAAGRLTRGAVQAGRENAGRQDSLPASTRTSGTPMASTGAEWSNPSAAAYRQPAASYDDSTPIAEVAAAEADIISVDPAPTDGYQRTGRPR